MEPFDHFVGSREIHQLILRYLPITVLVQLLKEDLLWHLVIDHVVTESLEDLLDSLWERCQDSLAGPVTLH